MSVITAAMLELLVGTSGGRSDGSASAADGTTNSSLTAAAADSSLSFLSAGSSPFPSPTPSSVSLMTIGSDLLVGTCRQPSTEDWTVMGMRIGMDTGAEEEGAAAGGEAGGDRGVGEGEGRITTE